MMTQECAGLVKTSAGLVLFGRKFPRHLQVAYGRWIFRMAHRGVDRGGFWLRDLPLSMFALESDCDCGWVRRAYLAECSRAGEESQF